MITEERIAKAKEKIDSYWDDMGRAEENNNSELYDYWLAKWSAAREIYEDLTDMRWNRE